MYYILTSKVEDDNEDAILEGDSPYLRRISCSFRDGISLPFDDIETPISFKIIEFALRGVMTDHLIINDIPGPVFSLDIKTLLEKKGIKNIEFYQLKLLDEFPDGKPKNEETDDEKKEVLEYNNYFIANVVGLIDCVDHDKSVLEYFLPPELRDQESEKKGNGNEEINDPFAGENPNDIDFITKLVLDESKIDPNLKVFRLKDKPHLLVFHESVVNLIRKENLRGFVFVPVEEYTDAIPDDDEKVEEATDETKQKQQFSQPPTKIEPIGSQPKEEPKEVKRRRIFFE